MRPVPAFFIEHPKMGFIAFDAGLVVDVAEKEDNALLPFTSILFQSRTLPGEDYYSQI